MASNGRGATTAALRRSTLGPGGSSVSSGARSVNGFNMAGIITASQTFSLSPKEVVVLDTNFPPQRRKNREKETKQVLKAAQRGHKVIKIMERLDEEALEKAAEVTGESTGKEVSADVNKELGGGASGDGGEKGGGHRKLWRLWMRLRKAVGV